MSRHKSVSSSVFVGIRSGRWKRKTGPDPYHVLLQSEYHRRGPKQLHHPPSTPSATNLGSTGVAVALRPQSHHSKNITLIENKERSTALQFREFSPRSEFQCTQDFPFFLGFMQKESSKMWTMLRESIDLVIEVRDVRVPFSSSNFFVTDNIPDRVPRIILLNKADLVESYYAKAAQEVIAAAGYTCFLTHGHDRTAARHVRECIFEHCDFHWKSVGRRVMVLGVPNVGKSSFINAMRTEAVLLGEALGHLGRQALTKDVYKEKLSRVTAEPTTTRHVLPFKITHDPKLYMYDTPGIMLPRLRDKEVTTKLACVGVVPASIGGFRYVADYLLFRLNQARCFQYVDEFSLDRPTNDITELADQISVILNADQTSKPAHGSYGEIITYEAFIHRYATGRLGRIPLDYLPSPSDLAYRGELNISEPPGPWGPSQYPDPVQGLS